MSEVKMVSGSPDIDTVHSWMRTVAFRNQIKDTTALRVWQLFVGSITNLKAKPGTKASEFVTPSGILTDKGQVLIKELDAERSEYLRQTALNKG